MVAACAAPWRASPRPGSDGRSSRPTRTWLSTTSAGGGGSPWASLRSSDRPRSGSRRRGASRRAPGRLRRDDGCRNRRRDPPADAPVPVSVTASCSSSSSSRSRSDAGVVSGREGRRARKRWRRSSSRWGRDRTGGLSFDRCQRTSLRRAGLELLLITMPLASECWWPSGWRRRGRRRSRSGSWGSSPPGVVAEVEGIVAALEELLKGVVDPDAEGMRMKRRRRCCCCGSCLLVDAIGSSGDVLGRLSPSGTRAAGAARGDRAAERRPCWAGIAVEREHGRGAPPERGPLASINRNVNEGLFRQGPRGPVDVNLLRRMLTSPRRLFSRTDAMRYVDPVVGRSEACSPRRDESRTRRSDSSAGTAGFWGAPITGSFEARGSLVHEDGGDRLMSWCGKAPRSSSASRRTRRPWKLAGESSMTSTTSTASSANAKKIGASCARARPWPATPRDREVLLGAGPARRGARATAGSCSGLRSRTDRGRDQLAGMLRGHRRGCFWLSTEQDLGRLGPGRRPARQVLAILAVKRARRDALGGRLCVEMFGHRGVGDGDRSHRT